MLISLDVITRNKLILVKQIYQRALIQSQFTHRVVDRMLAVVGFDLANETVLKAIAVALNATIKLKHPFPDVIKQVEAELGNHSKTLSDVIKIQRIHDLRNATQHHARYPSEIEVSDSRTYTRDFLEKTFFDVWGESFESISLVDTIQNDTAKNRLKEAELHLANQEVTDATIKSIVSFEYMIEGIATLLTERVSVDFIEGFIVQKGIYKNELDRELFKAFVRTSKVNPFVETENSLF